jgi:leucyl aminopeptidase
LLFGARQGSLTDCACDALIVNLFEGVKHPGGGTGTVDRALGGAISAAIQDEDFEGRLGQTTVIPTQGKIASKRVVLVGLGKAEELGIRTIMRAAALAARKCQDLKAGSVGSILHGAGIGGMSPFECAKATILGTALGAYRFTRHKTENVKSDLLDTFDIIELSPEKLEPIRQGIERGQVIAESVTFARDMVNEPSNVVTPAYLADAAKKIADEAGFECGIRGPKEIEAKGFGLLAAVARGSRVEPRFIELTYRSDAAQKTVAIVGKGITFDSGGYSLKNKDGIEGMKDDMAGAAAVLGAMKAVGKLKPAINVTALIPAAENMIGGGAIHPGDVFKSFDGKTVEINNTDAEGRLILADAIAYAAKLGVDEIVDAATLTWGCVVALGLEISGVFGSDQTLVDRILAAGKACGEQLWQLPLHADYKKKLDSEVADLKNCDGLPGTATIAAEFIRSFTNEIPWAHIDLSSASTDADLDLARKGASGDGAGTLIEYLSGF